MPLSRSQRTIWEKARALGSGGRAVQLSDEVCSYLICRVIHDLDIVNLFPDVPKYVENFFTQNDFSSLTVENIDPFSLYEKLVGVNPDGDMYFACLSSLHKARLKYEYILESQPIPNLEQVGPRGLLQYGKLSASGLVGLLLWRKWFYDIDNRAGQETGYLFEPVIANSIGGIPIPARRSPVKRHRDQRKGRQVDCLLSSKAYELKIRMTIAASGQGRWREELDFPIDCKESGFTPILIVLDNTPNPKLTELTDAFLKQGGEAYVGQDAWKHLDDLAGDTMAHFLEKYVRGPIDALINVDSSDLPQLSARQENDVIRIRIDDETLLINRRNNEGESEASPIPDDILDADL